jgi:23S rRNA pseudouridine1911/1915/1917 synthase
MRLDHFLVQSFPEQTRSQLKRLIESGHCLVNGSPERVSKKLRLGDVVELSVPEPTPSKVEPEKIPLDVLYEDEHLIVVDKPAGMVVHPAPGHSRGTLVAALLGHCEALSGVGGELRPGIVHRLDKLTSGVMVASKTDVAHLGLAEQFQEHSIDRRYVALVSGALEPLTGTFDTLHGRHPVDRKRYTTRVTRGRRAVTHYRVLRQFHGATMVEARLETGRTHQVRVHFAEHGHGLLGDPMYGRGGRSPEVKRIGRELGRQALHARALGFDHPVTAQRVDCQSEPPEDMQQAMAKLSELS